MHFIVTGGAGFIGSHVTEQLLAAGHRVTVVDTLRTGQLKNLPNHPDLKLMIKNISACQPSDFPEQIDGIAHLAATPSVTESWRYPLAAHDNNLSATIAVIQLCQALQIPRLVFASSAAVYGNPQALPVSELHPTAPISPYGLQKLVSEQYASLFAEQFGFSFVGLRLFNVFGPRQLPNSQYSGVISIFVELMRQNQALTIYGDGSQTRDFVYVKDVAIAFSQALTASRPVGSNLICNVGTGNGLSLRQLVNTLEDFYPQWSSEIKFEPSRLGDIQHSVADIAHAYQCLNFSPQWSVRAGLQELIDSSSVVSVNI